MKVSLLTDSNDIGIEIDRIIDNGVQLICLRDKTKPTPLNIKGRTQTKNGTLIIVQHPKKTICQQKKCLFYYHVKGQPVRCFHCIPRKQVDSLLALNYPDEIFEIQRRKYPRVKAYNDSWGSFSLANKQRVFGGKIIDVCMEGAKISGDFPFEITKGDIIKPLSMTLLFRFMLDEEIHVHIPEATVVRAVCEGNSTKEFSIHFTLSDKWLAPLGRYVDMRSLEEIS